MTRTSNKPKKSKTDVGTAAALPPAESSPTAEEPSPALDSTNVIEEKTGDNNQPEPAKSSKGAGKIKKKRSLESKYRRRSKAKSNLKARKAAQKAATSESQQ
jgi:hypothetical protein